MSSSSFRIGAVVVLMLCFAIPYSIARAEEASVEQLSLQDAISRALDENADLKAKRIGYQDAEAGLRTSRYKLSYGLGSDARLDRVPGDSSLSGLIKGDITYETFHGPQASV